MKWNKIAAVLLVAWGIFSFVGAVTYDRLLERDISSMFALGFYSGLILWSVILPILFWKYDWIKSKLKK